MTIDSTELNNTISEKIILDDIGQFVTEKISDIFELSGIFKSYYTGIINEENIINWLLQFGSLNNVKIAFKLLNNVNYFDTNKLVTLIVNSYKTIADSDLCICPVGTLYDSASMLIYSIGKKLNITEEELNHKICTIDQFISSLSTGAYKGIVFVDDNITSGNQLNKFISELFGSTIQHREHVKYPLLENEQAILRELPIYYCVAIELSPSTNLANKLKEEYHLKQFEIISGHKDYNNYLEYGTKLWSNEDEAKEAKDLVCKISYDLYTDKKGEWGDDKLRERLCGYGNLGKLTLFSHNIPKSLLPIFWKYGIYNGRGWFPLFPERNEWEKYKNSILNVDPYINHLSKSILSGLFGKPLPNCSAFIIAEKHHAKDVIISIPNDKIVNSIIHHKMDNKTPLEYQHDARSNMFPAKLVIETKDYDRYNKEVDIYNQEIKYYKINIEENIPLICSRFSLLIRVYNEGNGTANEVIIKITLPEGIDFVENMEELIIEEPIEPEPPTSPFLHRLNIHRPELSYLRSISENLGENNNPEKKYKISYEDDKKIITVYFGKILQHTFRDVELIQFILRQDINLLCINYSIIFEEAKYPINERFDLHFEKEEKIDEELLELLNIKT